MVEREGCPRWDGKDRCIDNVFVERLWRFLRYENVYLMAYAGPWEARDGIGEYFDYFNERRSYQALGNQTPMEVCRESVGAAEGGQHECLTVRDWNTVERLVEILDEG